MIRRKGAFPERLMVVFSPATSGWLSKQNENIICLSGLGRDIDLQQISDFNKIILVYEDRFYWILSMLDLLHRIRRNKDFFRGKLFLMIPRGRISIGERGKYEIRESEFIPIDVDELDQLPTLPQATVDPNSIELTPYAPDFWPEFTDLKTWFATLLKNGSTDLMRDRVYPQLKTGLLESQQRMLEDSHIGFVDNVPINALDALKGIFRHCLSSDDVPRSKLRKYRRSSDAFFGAYPEGDSWYRKWWEDKNPINELGRDLMPLPGSPRPEIIPPNVWAENGWTFHIDERRPLFPLLLWEGHRAKAPSMECFIPAYNFRELIGAMKEVLQGLPPSDLYPDIEGEKWVDVSDFRDGLGTITLAPLCKYGSDGFMKCRDIRELLWNIERPYGAIYLASGGTILMEDDPSPDAREYGHEILEQAFKPQVLSIRQILWDGDHFHTFRTSELVRHYAHSLAGCFDGNRECAIRYLDELLRKYGDHFPRKTRIVRHKQRQS